MYRVTNLFFLFLFLFNISMSAKTNIGFKKTLRVGWYEQFPFAYRKDVLGISTVLTGMDIELNRAIAKKVDFGLQFIETPWKTQLTMLKDGDIDVVLSGLESPERFKTFRVSDPIRTETTVIYVRNSMAKEFEMNKIESFIKKIKNGNLKIGVTRSEIYTDDTINKFISNPKSSKYIKSARSNFANLKNLKNGKVTAVLVDKTAGASIVHRNNWQGALAYCYSLKFETRNVSYLLSKQSTTEDNLNEINNAIRSLKSSGRYEQIVESYLFPVILNLTVNTWWVFLHRFSGNNCILSLRIEDGNGGKSKLDWNPHLCFYLCCRRWCASWCVNWKLSAFFMHQTVYSYTILLITIGVFLVSNVYDYVFSDKRKNKFIKKIHVFFLFLQRIFLKYIFDVIDAVGLAAFIVFGVIAALEVKAKPLILWGPILAMVTTSGGGVLCNMLRSYKFDMTMKNMFSEISIIWGFILSFLLQQIPMTNHVITDRIITSVVFTVVGAFLTRWLVCHFEIRSLHFLFVKWIREQKEKNIT